MKLIITKKFKPKFKKNYFNKIGVKSIDGNIEWITWVEFFRRK